MSQVQQDSEDATPTPVPNPNHVTEENDYQRWLKLMAQWRYEGKPRTLVTQRTTYTVHISAESNKPEFTRQETDAYASRSI